MRGNIIVSVCGTCGEFGRTAICALTYAYLSSILLSKDIYTIMAQKGENGE